MKTKFIGIIAVLLACVAATACANRKTGHETQNEDKMKTLILYYSQTGTTKAVAEALQISLDADIEAVEAAEPYSGSYDETIQRVQSEREQGVIPKIKSLKHNPKDYDIVFLGYPIWFGTYAPPIAALLDSVDFTGVTVVPFCSFGSGGLEASARDLADKAPQAKIKNGYGVRTARIAKMPEELNRFLIENGYIKGEIEPFPDFTEAQPVTDEQIAIFDAACSDYKFPLGTPITCSHRAISGGTEYRYSVNSRTPDGKEAVSTIYVIDDGVKPEFTKVVR